MSHSTMFDSQHRLKLPMEMDFNCLFSAKSMLLTRLKHPSPTTSLFDAITSSSVSAELLWGSSVRYGELWSAISYSRHGSPFRRETLEKALSWRMI